MTPGAARSREELFWLPYPKANRVLINSHNFTPWSPADIATQIWLDASDATTLYDATSGGSLVAADGSIARWEDKSGHERHFTQATSASRPVRKTSVQNSLDIVRFDGSDDCMVLLTGLSGLIQNVSGVTLACVASHRAAPGNQIIFFCATGTGDSLTGRFGFGTSISVANRQTLFGRRLDSQGAASILSGTNAVDTGFRSRIAVGKYSTSDADLYLDGTSDGSSSSWTTDGSTSNTTALRVTLGALLNGIQHANIDLCELVLTHNAESSDVISRMQLYFQEKWGVA